MSELKKIRATKYKSKQRYKDKSKIIPKAETNKDDKDCSEDKIIVDVDSKPFHKRSIESNWHRYEPKETDTVNQAKDFSLIASTPLAQGSYFQFKSDKSISDEVKDEQTESELFHLDLDLLNMGLAAIPFHVRCDVDEKYLTESQIDEMKERAEESAKEYDEYLDKRSKDKESRLSSACADTESARSESDVRSDTGQDVAVLETKVAKLGLDKEQDVLVERGLETAAVSPPQPKKESEGLEQWLDDILDD